MSITKSQIGKIKTGGRRKGSPNRATRILQENLKNRGFDWVDEFLNVYYTLDGEDRINALMKMLPFLAPKYSEIKVTTEDISREKTALKSKDDVAFLKVVDMRIASNE